MKLLAFLQIPFIKETLAKMDPKLKVLVMKKELKLTFKDLDKDAQKAILLALDAASQAALFATLERQAQKELFEILDAANASFTL